MINNNEMLSKAFQIDEMGYMTDGSSLFSWGKTEGSGNGICSKLALLFISSRT